jgi:hypothetical protein
MNKDEYNLKRMQKGSQYSKVPADTARVRALKAKVVAIL